MTACCSRSGMTCARNSDSPTNKASRLTVPQRSGHVRLGKARPSCPVALATRRVSNTRFQLIYSAGCGTGMAGTNKAATRPANAITAQTNASRVLPWADAPARCTKRAIPEVPPVPASWPHSHGLALLRLTLSLTVLIAVLHVRPFGHTAPTMASADVCTTLPAPFDASSTSAAVWVSRTWMPSASRLCLSAIRRIAPCKFRALAFWAALPDAPPRLLPVRQASASRRASFSFAVARDILATGRTLAPPQLQRASRAPSSSGQSRI